MFRRFFPCQKGQPDLTSDLLNAAVAEWIKTIPDDSRLEAFLEKLDPSQQAEIWSAARAIYDCAGAFLELQAGAGRIDTDEFNSALRNHLKSQFPWAQEPALDAMQAYTGWYAWHEGY